MGEGWVIWFGFACSFLVGMVWGAVPIVAVFFKVENLHDLAETLAAIATVVGVVLAVVGYSSWKYQVLAESDHDLSRRASLALQKYKEPALKSYELADRLIGRMYLQLGYREDTSQVLDGVMIELNSLRDAHSEMLLVAWECRDSWGEDIWDRFSEVFSLVDQCRQCVELFVRWSNSSIREETRYRIASTAVNTFDFIKVFVGDDSASAKKYIDDRCESLLAEFKAKRLA